MSTDFIKAGRRSNYRNLGIARKERQERAKQIKLEFLARTPEQQLELIASRRGENAREKERLSLLIRELTSKGIDSSKVTFETIRNMKKE